MTEHVTIALTPAQLERARQVAERLGISLESLLVGLIDGNLPHGKAATRPKGDISVIFGIGCSAEPTDIARDKDKMVDEAVWQEHLRKTWQYG